MCVCVCVCVCMCLCVFVCVCVCVCACIVQYNVFVLISGLQRHWPTYNAVNNHVCVCVCGVGGGGGGLSMWVGVHYLDISIIE